MENYEKQIVTRFVICVVIFCSLINKGGIYFAALFIFYQLYSPSLIWSYLILSYCMCMLLETIQTDRYTSCDIEHEDSTNISFIYLLQPIFILKNLHLKPKWSFIAIFLWISFTCQLTLYCYGAHIHMIYAGHSKCVCTHRKYTTILFLQETACQKLENYCTTTGLLDYHLMLELSNCEIQSYFILMRSL